MMFQAYVKFFRGLTYFKKTCKTLGYMKIVVSEIPPEGAKPYLSRGQIVNTYFLYRGDGAHTLYSF